MTLEREVAATIIKRLKFHRVEILVGEKGNMCLYISPDDQAGRSSADSDYARGLEQGAILELQRIIGASARLKQAILEQISVSNAAACDSCSSE